MGRANAVAVLYHWRGLGHGPMRLLVHMALSALDRESTDGTPPRLYWAPWEVQARALGLEPPPEAATDTYSVERRASVARIARHHRAALVQVGAISMAKAPAPGRPTMWEIHLEPDQ